MNQDKLYKYYTVRRPPDIGTVPKDFVNVKSYGELKQLAQSGYHAWGEVEYNRRLTDKEIYDYELVEDNFEEKKMEALQDMQSLDKIYKMLQKENFNDQKLNLLMDKISNLIDKEITNKIKQNNISHKEYLETIDKIHIAEMNKDEAIHFYANKIIYDCITDCSENNRIFNVDEYTNNDFLIKNFPAIVKKIDLDERVSDLQVDYDKKEIDMVFYLEYCPHYFQEDLDISDESRLKTLEEFKNYVCDCRAYTPERWLKTNTKDLINNYYTSKYDSAEDKDLVYNLLSEELYNSGFVDKYIDGYIVNVNAENIDDLVNTLDERIKELQLSLESGEI